MRLNLLRHMRRALCFRSVISLLVVQVVEGVVVLLLTVVQVVLLARSGSFSVCSLTSLGLVGVCVAVAARMLMSLSCALFRVMLSR